MSTPTAEERAAKLVLELSDARGIDKAWIAGSAIRAAVEAERARWMEYVVFLTAATSGTQTMAYVHGWRCPPETIEEGKRLREGLGLTDESIQEAIRARSEGT